MPPKIDKEKCDGCGICIFQCGAFCFAFNPDEYKVYLASGKDCVDCFICEEKCPPKAITMVIGRRV